jgi:hypothetical protein
MKTHSKWLAAALFAATVPLAPAAMAGTLPAAPAVPEAVTPVIPVQNSCNAVGQQVAAQHGGRLQSVQAQNRGGQTVCVGTVIVEGKDGQRGRVVSFEVPL